MAATVLLVNDDETSLKSLGEILRRENFGTLTAPNAEVAIAIASNTKVDLIVCDNLMPDVDGYSLCYRVRHTEKLRNMPIILYSDTLPGDEESTARRVGADIVIRKPVSPGVLLTAVTDVLERSHEIDYTGPKGFSPTERTQDRNVLVKKLEEQIKALERDKLKLESQLAERTEQVDRSIEELQVTNEELQASNEELITMNDQLQLANEKIQQQTQIIIQQQKAALQRTEENLAIIFSNTQEEILVLDQTGRAVFFNRSLERFIEELTGEKPAQGRFLWEIVAPERRDISRELFHRAVSGEVLEVEASFSLRRGIRHNLVRYSPILMHGKIAYVAIISTDITARKAQEQKVAASESKLNAIFENTVDSFTLLDRDFNIVAFNEKNAHDVRELLGTKLEVGKNVFETLPDDRHESFRNLITQVNPAGAVKTIVRYGESESERWFDISITRVMEENSIVGYCVTAHDLTEVKKAEKEIVRLNKSLLNFENAIHRASIVSRTDIHGNITFVNENFIRISGYSREELLGKNHRIVNSGYHPKSFWENMWKTITSGETWRDRVKNRAKDNSYYWVDTFITPFIDKDGNIVEYLSIRNDITERKEAEDELVQQSFLLEESARIAKIGYWVQDTHTGKIKISDDMLSIFEISQKEFDVDARAILKNIAIEDIELIADGAFFGAQPFEAEVRVKRKDSSIRWIHQKSEAKKIDDEKLIIIGTVQDITERKITEQVLRNFNERFEILSKATNDAIWDLDVRLDKVVWNYAIVEKFGYELGHINSSFSWWEQRIHADERPAILRSLGEAMRKQENTWSATFRFECADGSFKDVFNRSYIIYEKAKAVRVIGSLQDISDRVRYVREIEKLSLVASAASNAVVITDKNGLIEWVNDSFVKLTGYTLEEVKGRGLNFLEGSETDQAIVRRIASRLEKRQLVSEEIINYAKSGHKFWLKLDIAPVFNNLGELTGFISVQTDITAIKEFENSITMIARELANLIKNANVPIFGVDKDGWINEWNHVAESLSEFSRDYVSGKRLHDIFNRVESRKIFEQLIENALNDIPSGDVEIPLITGTGKKLILLVSASPRRSVQDEITGVIFVGQNATELINYRTNLEKMVEERTRELHIAIEKEKELVKMKSQFVSIASHEFRTPLTTIALAAGFIQKYKERLSPEAIEEKIASINKQVNHMTYLLDDILMVGKAEAGKIPVKLAPVVISDFIRDLCMEVTRSTGNTHQIRISENLRYREIMSDEKLLRNILINLLVNAIKFSPGADVIDLTYQTEQDHLTLTIKDYGIGIPESALENLFQPFFRAANVDGIQGTGLGLSIIKKAIDLLQGKLTVDSVVGRGTSFTIELPI
jgi:PAS domain S-box-containing protein